MCLMEEACQDTFMAQDWGYALKMVSAAKEFGKHCAREADRKNWPVIK